MRTWQEDARGAGGRNDVPWCCAVLVGINILVFLICRFWDPGLYEKGSFGVLSLLYGKEYYRLLTSMFLHADIYHLENNMILLYFGGEIVEKTVGRIRFLLLFFLSGLCGSSLSAAYELMTGSYYDSIGASGAVFGLIGALLYLVVVRRGEAARIPLWRVILMVVFSLYSGFRSTSVNNAAHLGGLLGGFLLAFLLCMAGRSGRRR